MTIIPSADDNRRSGVDNPAFENDTHATTNGKPTTNHPTTLKDFHFNHVSANANGVGGQIKDDCDFKTTEEMAEAVNLELLNMGTNGANNGLNGIPVKNPNSTVINISNPYDEYFIPVNEHRKYIR